MANDLHRAPDASAQPAAPLSPQPISADPLEADTGSSLGKRPPRTRTAAAWFGICVAALMFVVLIVFMLQNTGRVQVNFLGWQGTVPLALALLIAAVGAAIATMAVGVARITQLRRLTSRQRHQRRLGS
jgi:uncharacterized integral membrane protein